MPTINPPRPLTPGVYAGVVDDVAFLTLAWRISPSNPDGLTVRFGVLIEAEDGPAHVFDSIDFDHHDRLAMAYASCGKPMPQSPERAAQELAGHEGRPAACVEDSRRTKEGLAQEGRGRTADRVAERRRAPLRP
jgi:hypothetical protein